jgi:autotransporter-associated beta strand protein
LDAIKYFFVRRHLDMPSILKTLGAKLVGGLGGLLLVCSLASALTINGYDPTRHNRFSSGYPTAPVANTDADFIGLGYDWSGVGWSATNSSQSVVLLGPQHFLYANHYPPSATLQFCSSDGELKSYDVQTLSGSLGPSTTSDLAVGVLSEPIPSTDNVTYYSILFLGYSPASYYDYDLYVYGFTARIGIGSIDSVVNGITTKDGVFHSGYYFGYPFDTTTPDLATLQTGDSGSPSFLYDDATKQLYIAGAHFATSSTEGYDSALPLMLKYVNAYMAQTGYLPYVYTPVTAAWTGASSSSWGGGSNWSPSQVPLDVLSGGDVMSCASVLFDGAATTRLSINLNGNRTVTSITFAAADGANAFTISQGSSGTLTIGEAGITNNDDEVQTFNCPIKLRSSQRWDVGQGGLLVGGSINTGTDNLLVIEGEGNVTLSGAISGSGGIAKHGSGTLTLGNSSNSYTGTTWIIAGILALGNNAAIPGSSAVVVNGGTLDLSGLSIASETLTISGSGSGGIGAIVNSNTTGTAISSGAVILSGNAVIGGSGDITLSGSLDYGNYTLTKIGCGTLTISGSQIWGNNASAAVLPGTVYYQQAAGATTSVDASTSTLLIADGAVVNVDASNNDPFTDDAASAQHVEIINEASGEFNLTAGDCTVAGISGAGSTSVSGGATLTSGYIYQDTLTIAAGSKVIISPLSGSDNSLNLLSDEDLAEIFATVADAGGAAASAGAGGLSTVPEPSTGILLLLAGLAGFIRFIWRRRIFIFNAK